VEKIKFHVIDNNQRDIRVYRIFQRNCRFNYDKRMMKMENKINSLVISEKDSVANGKVVKAEAFGFNDIAISRLCNYV
jgi:altronate dehydratase large subunit